jgi:uncharacterized protein (DUF924 family)
MTAVPAADDVLRFWFDELTPKQWFMRDDAVDQTIAERFGALHRAAAAAELADWRQTVGGRLAEVIVLDQFSRNIHRGSALAFASDTMALVLAQEAIAAGADAVLPVRRRTFLYLPFMHSESAVVHEEALVLFAAPGMEQNLDYERQHKAIIDRFGRYPHRNIALGRESTADELAFLKEPGSSF